MSIKDSTREYRLSQWLPLIKDCRNSGMKVKDWCRQNNSNEKRYYYWQRKVREAATESLPVAKKQATFVQLSTSVEQQTVSQTASFVPSMIFKAGNVSVELSET